MNRTTIMIIAACVMLTLLGTGFYYVGRKIFCWLRLIIPASGGSHACLFAGICLFFFLSIALSFMPFDMGIKKHLVWFAWLLIGLFIYFLVFFALSDIVLLIGKLLRAIPAPTPPTVVIAVGWSVIVLVACMATYGIYNAKQIKHVSYNVPIAVGAGLVRAGFTPAPAPIKIALIADLHLWYVNDERWLAKAVDNINALQPDIVVIAGDIFNDDLNGLPNPDDALLSLQNIRTKYGVYACMGNHDSGSTHGDMLRFLEQGNVVVLQDEYAVVDDKFVVVGRTEASPIGAQGKTRKAISQVLEGVDTTMPVIVIDHSPSNKHEYGREVDLILSGHTHRGQMFPGNLITRLIFDVDYGHYRQDTNSPHIIVTSGAGVWGPPFRIGTNNEIVSVLVEFEQNE